MSIGIFSEALRKDKSTNSRLASSESGISETALATAAIVGVLHGDFVAEAVWKDELAPAPSSLDLIRVDRQACIVPRAFEQSGNLLVSSTKQLFDLMLFRAVLTEGVNSTALS